MGLPVAERFAAAAQPPVSSATTPPGCRRAGEPQMTMPAARSGRRSTPRVVWNFHPGSAMPGCTSTATTAREPRSATVEARRHPRHRQRRHDDRHGRAHHAAGHQDAPGSFQHGGLGRPGDRGRFAEDAGVHAPRHRDDDDRPRHVQRVPVPADDLRCFSLKAQGDGGDPHRHGRTSCSPVVAEASASTGARPQDADRRWARPASSGTTATTSLRPPASSSGTSATPRPTRFLRPQRSRSSRRGLGVRAQPRRPRCMSCPIERDAVDPRRYRLRLRRRPTMPVNLRDRDFLQGDRLHGGEFPAPAGPAAAW